MQNSAPNRHWNFQAKVLLPVVAVMVLLVAITLLVVNQRITSEFQAEAAQKLSAAEVAFKNSQKIRAKNLLFRYRNLANEPRFKAVSQLSDPKTLRHSFNELIDELGGELGGEVIVMTTDKGERLASVSRDPQLNITEFESHSAVSVKQALGGQPNVDTIRVGERLFDVVSIPVSVGENIVGVLTFGVEIGQSAAEEFKQLTHTEVVFLTSDRVAVSTLVKPDLHQQLVSSFGDFSTPPATAPRGRQAIREIILNNEHFLGLVGQFTSLSAEGRLAYLLLSSYEQPLSVLHATQRMLGVVSLLGIVFSTAIVWMLIRKITEPLRQLRNSAEAVGRGDFSHHVQVASRDECGELAEVFNRMTENLKTSRAQLEQTVETLKNTQAQLVQREKLSGIGQFIAGVAHELNNPLTAVIGSAELLRETNVSERHRRLVDMMMNGAQRCHRIVQSLLSFARQHKPERELIALNDLVEEAAQIMLYQMRTSNIQVVRKLEPQLPAVLADPHQLEQVFLNIINNARQAMEAHQSKGELRIATERSEGRVRVSFEDNGPGISEENLARIFDPFFTTKEVGKGTGLGLSICYGIIKEHGGTIHVRSKLGQGTSFIIELPATDDESAPVQTTDDRARPQNTREGVGKKVLVVDDEETILHLIHEALATRGYEVDVVRDGETALRHFGQTRYDLTVCDWKMPGLNGREVYERLREIDPQAAERVIFITGDVINEKTQKFLEEHGNVCLAKPFSVDDFRSAVGKVLKAA